MIWWVSVSNSIATGIFCFEIFVSDWPITNEFKTETHHTIPTPVRIREKIISIKIGCYESVWLNSKFSFYFRFQKSGRKWNFHLYLKSNLNWFYPLLEWSHFRIFMFKNSLLSPISEFLTKNEKKVSSQIKIS